MKHEGALVDGGVAEHVEWILQKQFKTVEEWLGPEGKKLPAVYIEIWRARARSGLVPLPITSAPACLFGIGGRAAISDCAS